MAKTRVYPHRVAGAESVSWGDWLVLRDGRFERCAPVLKGWDYASVEELSLSVKVVGPQFLAETGLDSLDEVELVAIADCAQSQRRIVSTSPFASGALEATVALTLPPRELATSIRLSGYLVLSRDRLGAVGLRAKVRGAHLHASSPLLVALEGDAGRFPTEIANFSELGYPTVPWTVITKFSDLADSFVGTVRLLLNKEHPIGRMAVDPEWAPRLSSIIRLDIFRVLIGRLAGGAMDGDQSTFEEASVGAVIEGMCELFLGRSIESACLLYRDDPSEFERLLQSRLEPFSWMVDS